MQFGEVALDAAEGAILAHSVHVAGRRMRKGQLLAASDIDDLAAAGVARVMVARLGPDDVHEDAAALRIAQAVVPDTDRAGLCLQPVGTGRVNVTANAPGVVEVLAERINALNAVDPMITLATVPEWQRIEQGGMVATVKIISYGVARESVAQACAAGLGALRLRPVRLFRVALVETTVNDADNGQSGKGQRVMAQRLQRLGADLATTVMVPHRVEDLTTALVGLKDHDAVLILTGSATSDAHDVAPEALRAAGGTVHHFGMPVDPGNLLFIGEMAGRPVIGLPGCARSPALNGADWVLERVLCQVPVGRAEIMAMGVGGLLKEIPSRPRPREL